MHNASSLPAEHTADAIDRRRRSADRARLWRVWRKRGDASARERLIESLMPLARAAGRRAAGSRLPSCVEAEDVVAAAYVGLVSAVDNYDPCRGASVETFVTRRCEGAALDLVRQQLPGSRGLMEYERDRRAVVAELRREPSHDELVEALGVSPAAVRTREMERVACRTVPLDGPSVTTEEERVLAPADVLASHDRRDDPEASLELADTKVLVHEAIRELSDRQRAVLAPDLEGTPLDPVGDALGVSLSRVNQLRRQTMGRLRVALEPHRNLALAS
jgi:RNA polymerase sigma factor for flagellar operon FliA